MAWKEKNEPDVETQEKGEKYVLWRSGKCWKSGTNTWQKLRRNSSSARVEECFRSYSGERDRPTLLISLRSQGLRKDEDFSTNP
jgi:hypothetical protein